MSEFLGLVNTFRANRGLAAIPESQIESDKYQRFDVRVSKAVQHGRGRVELIGQVFNLFGTINLGGIGVTRQTNALSNAFGQILSATAPGRRAGDQVDLVRGNRNAPFAF